jgi:intracellular sulfur oxidation DsrE/DsrF family protein
MTRMTIKKLEKRIEEQQEQINMLIELANNFTERFESDQIIIKNHRKAIKSLIHNSEIDKHRLDEIKNFLKMVHLELFETNNSIIN